MLLPAKLSDRRSKLIYWIVILAVIVFGIVATIYAGHKAYRISQDSLVARVNTVAEVVDEYDVLALAGSEDDLGAIPYERVKALITGIRSVNPDTRFIYLNGIKDGLIFFYVDSEPPESEDYSPPGQSYEEASPLMHAVFAGKENGFEIERDRWGLWASALVPMRHPVTGDIIALVGMDVPGGRYVGDIIAYGSVPFLLTLIILIFIVTVQHILKREQRYVAQKAEFISIASHEIRAPLTAIRWAAETILQRRPTLLDESTKSTTGLILESCNKLISRVNNLLDMSALQTLGAGSMHKKVVPLRPILEDITQTLKLTATAHGVNLVIEDSLGPDITAECDPEQIRHVLVNLVINALKFTKDNSKVRISYALNAGFHEVSVDDQGIGIAEEDIPKIFKGYFRTEEARKEKEGTGLGLYVARNIARLHGGDIVVRSKQGVGSTFTLKLPK